MTGTRIGAAYNTPLASVPILGQRVLSTPKIYSLPCCPHIVARNCSYTIQYKTTIRARGDRAGHDTPLAAIPVLGQRAIRILSCGPHSPHVVGGDRRDSPEPVVIGRSVGVGIVLH